MEEGYGGVSSLTSTETIRLIGDGKNGGEGREGYGGGA